MSTLAQLSVLFTMSFTGSLAAIWISQKFKNNRIKEDKFVYSLVYDNDLPPFVAPTYEEWIERWNKSKKNKNI